MRSSSSGRLINSSSHHYRKVAIFQRIRTSVGGLTGHSRDAFSIDPSRNASFRSVAAAVAIVRYGERCVPIQSKRHLLPVHLRRFHRLQHVHHLQTVVLWSVLHLARLLDGCGPAGPAGGRTDPLGCVRGLCERLRLRDRHRDAVHGKVWHRLQRGWAGGLCRLYDAARERWAALPGCARWHVRQPVLPVFARG